MTKSYKITRGNQYDAGGAVVVHGRNDVLRCYYTHEARHLTGDAPHYSDRPAVEAAVLRVIVSGGAETITLGEPEPERTETPLWRSPRGLTLAEEMDREDSIY